MLLGVTGFPEPARGRHRGRRAFAVACCGVAGAIPARAQAADPQSTTSPDKPD